MSMGSKAPAFALVVLLSVTGPIAVYAGDDGDARINALEAQVTALSEKVDDMAKAMDIWFNKFDGAAVKRVEPEPFVAGYKRAKADECH